MYIPSKFLFISYILIIIEDNVKKKKLRYCWPDNYIFKYNNSSISDNNKTIFFLKW